MPPRDLDLRKYRTTKSNQHQTFHWHFFLKQPYYALHLIDFYCRYEGVVLRSLLAAIDHNHHLHRKQAINAKGELVYSRRWSKRSKRWKIVLVKEKKNYSYLPFLCAMVIQALGTGTSSTITYEYDPKIVAPTIATLPAPPTTQLVEENISRF